MSRKSLAVGAGIFICAILVLSVFGWYYIGTKDFMRNMGELATDKGSELLGSHVGIGTVRLNSLHSLTVSDIIVLDKQDKIILKAESADVGFSFFGMLNDKPAKAVSSVSINRPQIYVTQRDDGKWNYEDLLQEDSEPSGFGGVVSMERGELTLSMNGNALLLTDVDGEIDMAKSDAMKVDLSARDDKASARVSGTLGDDMRISVEGKDISVENYLSWLPVGTLPESVEIKSADVGSLSAIVTRSGEGGEIAYSGQAKIENGKIRVLDTEIYDLVGAVKANNGTISVNASMAAEGEKASVRGSVYLPKDENEDVRLELIAESDGLDPSKIMKDIPYSGRVKFRANINGTPKNPLVEGELSANEGNVYGYDFSRARAKVAYSDGKIALKSLKANIFDGEVDVSGEFDASKLKFDGTAKLGGVDVSGLGDDITSGATGRVSGDLGFAGEASDISNIALYGSASLVDGSFGGVVIPAARGSFYYEGGDLMLDYVSCALENEGELGVEGTVNGITGEAMTLDLAIYGTHVDLSIAKNIEEKLNISGFGDFNGTVKGDGANPNVSINFAAINGKLFEQPYRSLHGSASGSMDGVGIDSFSMENGDGVNWLVQGTVGFTGEKKINLQIDTMDVRMENIVDLVSPGLPLTGNVDNILTITGTLDNPHAVGYIHFDRGSYDGYLISGMDGDYTLNNGIMTLQDFHIFSPLIDMDLNGTVDIASLALDLVVEAHDVDLDRFGSRLPYPIHGHGKFNGHITGTVTQPAFDGVLDAPSLDFNGEIVENAHGEVRMRGNKVIFAPLGFAQNGGKYSMTAEANLDSESITGKLTVENGDINSLMAVLNAKNDIVHGKINGTIDIGGTVSSPYIKALVYVTSGDIAGYPINDVYLDGNYNNRVISLSRFDGSQGTGKFAATGTIDLDGDIDARVSLQKISAGIIPASMGSSLSLSGTMDAEAELRGSVNHPIGEGSITITSGGVGASAFDTMAGLFKLRGSVIEISQCVISKSQAGHEYRVSASGFAPIRAFTSELGDEVEGYDEFNLNISLDNGDLGLLPFMSDSVEWAMGETHGSVNIGGTLAAPRITGSIKVNDGAVKLKDMMLPFTDMQMGVDFRGDTMSISGISGKLGSGSFNIGGSTRLVGREPVDYNLKINADKMDVQTSFFRGPVTGNLELGEGEVFGHRLPKVTGNVEIDNVTVSVPSIPESEGELPNVIMDVGIHVGKHTHLYSYSLYDIWLADSNVHFGGTTRHPKASGSIETRRGTVTYLQTIFRIMEGKALFNQVDSFMPSIVFKAGTRLSRTRVFLGIEGPISGMKFHLQSSPPMSQEQIIKLLTLRDAYRKGEDMSGAEMAALLGAGLQMSFVGDITDSMRTFLNLDLLTITQENAENRRDNSHFSGYNIKIGKYISDKVMLEYTHGINQHLERFFVRYDFNDRFSAFVGRREGNDNFIGFESRISF